MSRVPVRLGVCPVYNIETQQSLWGQMPSNGRCEHYMGMFDYVFERMRDPETRKIFESWLEQDPAELNGEGTGGVPTEDLRPELDGARG